MYLPTFVPTIVRTNKYLFLSKCSLELNTKLQFNVTNAEEIQKSGAKPKLVEVGPYVFDEYHKKVNLVWSNDNGTVTYKQVS